MSMLYLTEKDVCDLLPLDPAHRLSAALHGCQ
jgi:hypothetical protein